MKNILANLGTFGHMKETSTMRNQYNMSGLLDDWDFDPRAGVQEPI